MTCRGEQRNKEGLEELGGLEGWMGRGKEKDR